MQAPDSRPDSDWQINNESRKGTLKKAHYYIPHSLFYVSYCSVVKLNERNAMKTDFSLRKI